MSASSAIARTSARESPSSESRYTRLVSKKPTKPGEGDLPFEEALSQLESIIERIEAGEIGLEQSLLEYERGVALLKRCREVLTRAEQRVQELDKDLATLRESDKDVPD